MPRRKGFVHFGDVVGAQHVVGVEHEVAVVGAKTAIGVFFADVVEQELKGIALANQGLVLPFIDGGAEGFEFRAERKGDFEVFVRFVDALVEAFRAGVDSAASSSARSPAKEHTRSSWP